MDMALELGMPVGVMSRAMPLSELYAWHAYARRHLLPSRRVEIYLAQIALLIAKTMGGAKHVTLADFMLQPADEPEPEPVKQVSEAQLERLKQAFDFRPRNKR